MNRAETTRFLGELLKSDRFRGMGKYWASEVSVDAFTAAGPVMRDKYQEFEEPTPISEDVSWRLEVIRPCIVGTRKKSLTELLFCMVRSGH